jgi:Glycosyl hydrolase family 79 C-terminal beta domain
VFERLAGLTMMCAGVALAQSPVTFTVDTEHPGAAVPAEFPGLSFESSNLLPQPSGRYFFSRDNRALVAAFRLLGIRSLRIGGGTADIARYAVPHEKDIDSLFAFADAADVKVIYTLRLPAADVDDDAAVARYIEQHYRSRLTCFEIGNEPDYYRRVYRDIPDYPTYRVLWKRIADAVVKADPDARFCGPAAGGITAWSRSFAEDFGKTGRIAAVVQHEYPGGDGNLMSGAPARDALLSRAWMEFYDRLYVSFAAPALAGGLPYRLEETNNFTGGAKDATDTFAASLWALDYLHWWAAHGASGINFHNRRWILNTTIYPVKNEEDGLDSGYLLHPIAYGIKAFVLGSHGAPLPVAVANPDAVNVNVYAIRDGRDVYVTVINKKDPGTPARDIAAKIKMPLQTVSAEVLYLSAPGNEVAAKEGITLGGASLANGSWDGKWVPVGRDKEGEATVTVPGTSAAVVRMSIRQAP